MKMHKIKLLLVMLCGGFGMLSRASEMSPIYTNVYFCIPRLGEDVLGLRIYEGMPYVDLDAQLKDLFRLLSDVDITLKIKGDKLIEPTRNPEKFLDINDLKKMRSAPRVNIHYRDKKR